MLPLQEMGSLSFWKRCSLVILALLLTLPSKAQMTTSEITGNVFSGDDVLVGAIIELEHIATGTYKATITDYQGNYSFYNVISGGPYKLTIRYIGYYTQTIKDIYLALGEKASHNVELKQNLQVLKEAIVISSKRYGLIDKRTGTPTSVSGEDISNLPSVDRSLNDIMRLSVYGINTSNGFALGGGNYRQSHMSIDGASFNNAFGIGGNLPGGGSPISIDAIDQLQLDITPFDVRQSGFTGGAINAITKRGTNQFSAQLYLTNTGVGLTNHKISDPITERTVLYKSTHGISLGGAIVKNKLFFFINAEFDNKEVAGPTAIARSSEGQPWSASTVEHRPTKDKIKEIKDYLSSNYGYNPGRYQDYSIKTPAYRILGRLDWHINNNNRLNVRFTGSQLNSNYHPFQDSSPLNHNAIYPGGADGGQGLNSGRLSATSLYFESARYMKQHNFSSLAGELISTFGGIFDNTFRATYSFMNDTRSYVGGSFPTVDILDKGSVYTAFGPDLYTAGNKATVGTCTITDNLNIRIGMHKLLVGVQLETNSVTNAFAPGANGYYVYSSFEDFMNNATPLAYALSYNNSMDGTMFQAIMNQHIVSGYTQIEVAPFKNMRISAGIRADLPTYSMPLENENEPLHELSFGGKHFSTSTLPNPNTCVSPRFSFNWDIAGDGKYVLRGGTGHFVGSIPFVWLISLVGNSNVGQNLYFYEPGTPAKYSTPRFHTSVQDQLQDMPNLVNNEIKVPQSPTIFDPNLKMNSVWKNMLALDAVLPGKVKFSLEGIYSREINPVIVMNEGVYQNPNTTITISPNDTRPTYSFYIPGQNVYYLTNAGNQAYSYSVSAGLAKTFAFGLSLSASYTYANTLNYGDGAADQVSESFYYGRYSIGGNNLPELGYSTYVAPNRLLISATYTKDYAKHWGTRIGLVYDGMNMGSSVSLDEGGTRYSYTFTSNVVGDKGSHSLLYVPASREELDSWNFGEGVYEDEDGVQQVYSAEAQKDDFWSYINQDRYLRTRKGAYTERGGAIMPWHNQIDLKIEQNFYYWTGPAKATKNTIKIGIDIKNLANLLNNDWGHLSRVNNIRLLQYNADGTLSFAKNQRRRLTSTYSNEIMFNSSFAAVFSVKYLFN